MIRDFILEIFRIHEQFAAGELNQSGGSYRYMYKMYILAHAGNNTISYKVNH
jgi:hypothetical protein